MQSVSNLSRQVRRPLLAIFVILVASVAPLPASAESAAAETAHEQTEDAVAAGADFFDAIVFGSGVTDMIFEGVRSQLLPELRTTLTNTPLYRNASPDKQLAILAFIDTVPDLLRVEFTGAMTEVGERSSRRFAVLMSPQHLRESAAFLRSAELHPLWQDLLVDVFDTETDAPDFPDWSGHPELAAFDQTEAGRAFAQHRETVGDILDEELHDGLTRIEPRMRIVLLAGMCDALGDECPEYLRDAAGRI